MQAAFLCCGLSTVEKTQFLPKHCPGTVMPLDVVDAISAMDRLT